MSANKRKKDSNPSANLFGDDIPSGQSFRSLPIGEHYRYIDSMKIGLDEVRAKVADDRYVAIAPLPGTAEFITADPEVLVAPLHLCPSPQMPKISEKKPKKTLKRAM